MQHVFLSLVFPLADIRFLLPHDSGRLKKPSWEVPKPKEYFVRYLGGMRIRALGYEESLWDGEQAFFSFSHGLRFPSPEKVRELFLPPEETLQEPWAQKVKVQFFRRLYKSRDACVRFEVGLNLEFSSFFPEAQASTILSRLYQTFESLPVTVYTGGGTPRQTTLLEAGSSLASRYLDASTHQGAATQKWWVKARNPLMFIGYNGQVVSLLEKNAGSPQGLADLGFQVQHASVWRKDIGLKIWAVCYNHLPYHAAQKQYGFSEVTLIRSLKMNLIRIHTEKEALEEVLLLVESKKMETAQTALAQYLKRVGACFYFSPFARKKPYQRKLFEYSFDLDYLFDAQRTDRLLSGLNRLSHRANDPGGTAEDRVQPKKVVKFSNRLQFELLRLLDQGEDQIPLVGEILQQFGSNDAFKNQVTVILAQYANRFQFIQEKDGLEKTVTAVKSQLEYCIAFFKPLLSSAEMAELMGKLA